MTSGDHGHNRLPATPGRIASDAKRLSPQDSLVPANLAPPAPSPLTPTAGMPQAPAVPAEPSVSGLRLPEEFSTRHFFDPAFLTGMANEMYNLGQSIFPAGDDAECLLADAAREAGVTMPTGSNEATSATARAARPALNFHDPMQLFGTDLLRSSVPGSVPAMTEVPGTLGIAGLPGMPEIVGMPGLSGLPGMVEPSGFSAPTPGMNPSEGYYFLTQQTPIPATALPAAPPSVIPNAPPVQAGSTPNMAGRPFQIESIRADFPILHQRVHGKPLIWLDNAATTQKPRQVIDAVSRFYQRDNSNIHRAAHTLAARSTQAYEDAREKVRRFLGAAQVEEIVFVHGATEAINLVAGTFGKKFIGPGDEIVLTTLEHHSNIVPWFQLAQEQGAVLRVAPVNDRGEILLDEFERLLGPRTRLVGLTQVSNALGTVVPVRTMAQLARRHGARVLIDGSQSVPHMAVDVQSLDADFFVFSGHKLFAPTGIGVLYGKKEVLDIMPPWQGGGNMIDQVSFEEVTYQPAPAKFEAGTGILAGAVGLGAAIDYLEELGMDNISRYEHELLAHATEEMSKISGLRMIGTAAEKASVLSFILEGTRPEEVGRFLDQQGIAVRSGHHCAQPALRRFGLTATVRPSLAFYNTHSEVEALVDAVRRARNLPG